MASPLKDDMVKQARSLIESARLPHPSGPLLDAFITEALDPRLAAQYVLQTCRRPGHEENAELLLLVSDWSYIVGSSTCIKSQDVVALIDKNFSLRVWQPSTSARPCHSYHHHRA